MKKGKANELWKLSDDELNKELGAAREALFKLKFQAVVDEVTDKSIVRKAKRKIARIKTILRARELSSDSGKE